MGKSAKGCTFLRRDTSSYLNSAAGGRLFPGIHHHGRFQVEESHDHYRIIMAAMTGERMWLSRDK